MGAVSVQESYLNFINGDMVAPATGKWLLERSPRDQTIERKIADSDLMDVVRAVQAANKALPNWIKSTDEERIQLLLRVASLIEERATDLANAVFDDLGTSVTVTLRHSIPAAVEHFRAHAWSLEPKVMGRQLSPIGLVAGLFPASDPLVCVASRVAPALANGNAMIAKVSRHTPATGVLISQIIHEAGFPPGVFALLHGRGEEVGEALVRHPGISTLSFMGSTETGRIVALSAAEAFKKMHYSMGAKNPVIVFANTDLSVTIPQVARLCLGLNPSQAFKGSRLFIQESIFKTALELLKTEIERSDVAPLAKRSQVIRFNEAVALALNENGKVITSVHDLPTSSEHFVKPYLFADLTNCSTLYQEEIAGPLILATSFKYQHEALKHANVSPYGRLGFVFESDEEKALRVARKIEVGSVFINSSDVHFDALEEIPLEKQSGFAPEGGGAMARFFSRSLTVFSLDK